jgi:hypothetical protein
VHTEVREVEAQLNAAATEGAPADPPGAPPSDLAARASETVAAQLPNPADAAPADAPRQNSLPGFDKI